MEKELFDLAKHRFGMAYCTNRQKTPVYLYDLSRSGASGYGIPVDSVFGRCKPVLVLNIEGAYRVPEFDMPPPVDKIKSCAAAAKAELDKLLNMEKAS